MKLEKLNKERFKPINNRALQLIRGGAVVQTSKSNENHILEVLYQGRAYRCEKDEFTYDNNGGLIKVRIFNNNEWEEL